MIGVQEFENTNESLRLDMKNYLDNFNQELSESRLYVTATEELVVNKEERFSRYRTLNTPEIFDDYQMLIDEVNKKNKFCEFILFKNNITEILYEEGDFFKPHEDYLSIKSKIMEEYTMIYCLEANCDGGETILHINENFSYKSEKSKTDGSILIFKKNILHEGALLTRGYKRILTANLISIEKTNKDLVIITFLKSEGHYIIPYSNVRKQTSLIRTIFETNEDNSKFKEYLDQKYTYEEFSIVYDILMGKYISKEDFEKYKHVYDYYLIDLKNVMFTRNLEEIIPREFKTVKFDKDIVITNTEEEWRFFGEQVKTSMYNYVSFKILFAEGTNSFGGEMTGEAPVKINMQPVWCSFSDYNNLLFYTKLMSKETNPEFFEYVIGNENDDNEYLFRYDRELLSEESFEEILYFKPTLDENDDDQDDEGVKGVPIDDDIYFNDKLIMNCQYGAVISDDKEIINLLIDGDRNYPVFCNTDLIKNSTNIGKYCLDKNGRSFLNLEQSEALFERIKKLNFLDKVKSKINNIQFMIPQHKAIESHNFCNEDVYSKFNILCVTGFVKF